MVMVNLGSTDDSRYTGYREITDRDVLDLQCIKLDCCTVDVSEKCWLTDKKYIDPDQIAP